MHDTTRSLARHGALITWRSLARHGALIRLAIVMIFLVVLPSLLVEASGACDVKIRKTNKERERKTEKSSTQQRVSTTTRLSLHIHHFLAEGKSHE